MKTRASIAVPKPTPEDRAKDQEVRAYVDKLVEEIEALDVEARELKRQEAAKVAGQELDFYRHRLDEARKVSSTPTGALMLTLGLGRPQRQGGKARKPIESVSAAVAVAEPRKGVKRRRRSRPG